MESAKKIDSTTYHFQDWLRGIRSPATTYGEKHFDDVTITSMLFNTQLDNLPKHLLQPPFAAPAARVRFGDGGSSPTRGRILPSSPSWCRIVLFVAPRNLSLFAVMHKIYKDQKNRQIEFRATLKALTKYSVFSGHVLQGSQ